MCFSAQASVVAGLGLLGLGTITVKRARNRRELPYALIPLLFGIQQLLEGMLWLSFSTDAPGFKVLFSHLYLLFSNVLWPTYVPLAVLALETVPWRRRVIVAIAYLGAAISAYLLGILLWLPLITSIDGHHILYDFPNPYEHTTMLLYIFVTCVSLFLSSHKRIAAFGVAVFASEVTVYMFYRVWLISVWCFFAAVLSAIVLWYFMDRNRVLPTT